MADQKMASMVIGLFVMGAWFCYDTGLFVSTPTVRVSGASVVVGKEEGDHAAYWVTRPGDIYASVVDYRLDSFGCGGGILSDLGGRGLLSFMPSWKYDQLVATQRRTHECMGSCLNQYESGGQIGHLVLIPKDAQPLSQMKKCTLDAGATFHLRGQFLALQNAQVHGRPCNISMGDTQFFLVESLERN